MTTNPDGFILAIEQRLTSQLTISATKAHR